MKMSFEAVRKSSGEKCQYSQLLFPSIFVRHVSQLEIVFHREINSLLIIAFLGIGTLEVVMNLW